MRISFSNKCVDWMFLRIKAIPYLLYIQGGVLRVCHTLLLILKTNKKVIYILGFIFIIANINQFIA